MVGIKKGNNQADLEVVIRAINKHLGVFGQMNQTKKGCLLSNKLPSNQA